MSVCVCVCARARVCVCVCVYTQKYTCVIHVHPFLFKPAILHFYIVCDNLESTSHTHMYPYVILKIVLPLPQTLVNCSHGGGLVLTWDTRQRTGNRCSPDWSISGLGRQNMPLVVAVIRLVRTRPVALTLRGVQWASVLRDSP